MFITNGIVAISDKEKASSFMDVKNTIQSYYSVVTDKVCDARIFVIIICVLLKEKKREGCIVIATRPRY